MIAAPKPPNCVLAAKHNRAEALADVVILRLPRLHAAHLVGARGHEVVLASARYIQWTGSKRVVEIANGLATLVNGRITDLTKFHHGVKSIGRRVRRVAIDLANDR